MPLGSMASGNLSSWAEKYDEKEMSPKKLVCK
jgi:hypothetical protein